MRINLRGVNWGYAALKAVIHTGAGLNLDALHLIDRPTDGLFILGKHYGALTGL